VSDRLSFVRVACIAALLGWPGARASAQVTPAAGSTPPDDTPSIKVGAVIFADYTIQQEPKATDSDGNSITANSFNIGRSYINITGNISHLVAFRITPDITRETGAGSSLNGSYTFRIKYAFAQFNLDDWLPRGSWVRLGIQQTPWVEFMEGVYRYRFQGQVFPEREGYISSSDAGASFHYAIPGNYGELHAGLYNGEGYQRAETNDQKGYMLRGTVRPLRMHPVLRGLRLTGFWDQDAYVKNADRHRGIVSVTFEHQYLNAAFDYLATKDQTSASKAAISGRGWSAWATPRTTRGWEGLLRFDHLEPSTTDPARKDRTIAGVAYWFPHQGTVSTALMLDVDNTTFDNYTPAQPTQRRIALHALVSF
jgi:hypothetical protein